jgi:hypothetical protein
VAAAQVAHATAHDFDQVGAGDIGKHRVTGAGDEAGGLLDVGAVVGAKGLPVALGITVTVDRAAEAAAVELPDVVIEIVFAEPIRQAVGLNQVVEKAAVLGLVGEPRTLRCIAGKGMIDAAQAGPHVGFQFGFGDALFLEIEVIEETVLLDLTQHLSERHLAATGVGDAEPGDSRYLVRMQERRVPGDRRPPVMADDGGGVGAKGANDPGDITGEGGHVIGLDRVRLVGAAVAAHIDRGDPETGLGEGSDLMAPGVPTFRKTMGQNDQGPIAGDRDSMVEAVGVDGPQFGRSCHIQRPATASAKAGHIVPSDRCD